MLADPAHREVARIAAERSAVLLRNEGALLPLDAALGLDRRDRPAGRLARDTTRALVFDYDLNETVTVLEGIRARPATAAGRVRARRAGRRSASSRRCSTCSATTRRRIPKGSTTKPSSSARSMARGGRRRGRRRRRVAEHDRRGGVAVVAGAAGRQLELLQAVVETGTPVVLLVMNGRPLDLRWAAEHVPAILDIWYPGTQGGAAVANLLFGDVSPAASCPSAGRGPSARCRWCTPTPSRTSPRSRHQRYWDEASTPLFPFGHGLSYCRFEYGDRPSIGRASPPARP